MLLIIMACYAYKKKVFLRSNILWSAWPVKEKKSIAITIISSYGGSEEETGLIAHQACKFLTIDLALLSNCCAEGKVIQRAPCSQG